MAEYDAENIFAKIIDGKVPCFKVFESKATLAFLDAFPMVEGHTVVVPKSKGATTLLEMSPAKAADYLHDLQKVAKAVKEATGATGVNIWQNNGEDAGQTVHHPHFHIVPRHKDDKLHSYPPSAKEMLSPDAAKPMVGKIEAALNPPKPLKKAMFAKVSGIKPDSKGLNLCVCVVGDAEEVTGKGASFYEVKCADATCAVVLSLKEDQKKICEKGKSITIRNGNVKMIKGHVRVTVDKWGKIEASEETVEPVADDAKNVSATEYELA